VVNDKNDLWHLENMIKPGDFVTAKTLRTIFIEREEKKEKVKRKLVVLKIKVEKVEFHKTESMLRIKGKIVECPEDVQKGSYHTIDIEMRTILTIEKKVWSDEEKMRLRQASTRIKIADQKLLEEFFIHINKNDGLATYGLEQVKTAAEYGAVKIVLIPEVAIRKKEVEEVARAVESKRGEVRLVSESSQLGKNFCKQHDVGTILRFRI
jgi:stalled ribosome rescue protein Dom34